jgi:nucleoside-diphosphate-sugar epimerase
MPSYAVLGATGNTGRALLQLLLKSPENQIHAYCRSKSKLLRLCPAAADNKHVRVFEGSLEDVSLLADCIRGTRAVFLTVAVIDNMPGCTIAMDTARVMVAALKRLQTESSSKATLPKLIVLSSASLEDSFCGDVPAFVHTVLSTAVSNLYKDLAEAERYLRAEQSWITTVFIKPGGLVHDKQKGHEISTTTAKTPLSFLDLAAGMVEVADCDNEVYDMKNVSVLPTANDVAFPWDGIYFAFTGLLYHFFPWTYHYLGEYPSPKPLK